MTKSTISPTENWLSGFSKLSLLSKLSDYLVFVLLATKSNYCQISLHCNHYFLSLVDLCALISIALSLYVRLNMFHH